MAQKVITEYIDDIDGSEAAGTTSFAIDGQRYEIDLSERNRNELDKALRPYIEAARRVDGRREGGSRPPAPRRRDTQLSRRVYLSQVRAWAREHGHKVSDQGRVPEYILHAYEARQS